MNNKKQILSDLITSQSNRPNPKKGEVYQHFKGNYYTIEGIAFDTESESEVVVYRALYGEYKLFTRSLDNFMQVLAEEVPRFTKVELRKE